MFVELSVANAPNPDPSGNHTTVHIANKDRHSAEGRPTDSHKNSSERERHRDGETETPRKQQAYSLALGGFPNGLCVESIVHRMALLGGMEP